MVRMLLTFLMVFILVQPIWGKVLFKEQSEQEKYQVEEITTGLEIPWGMAFLDPHRLLITERVGRVRILNLQSGERTTVGGLPQISANGQGGLLDVVLEPGYQPGGWLYFTYCKQVPEQQTTVLARARLSADRLTDWQDLLISKATSTTGRHFGSRIVFDGAGHLFFSIGDRGVRPNGQNLQTHAGSILRLNLDGSTPADNPLTANNQGLPEIWSYGHRNPQGLAYDTENKRLWAIEHGPRGGDEINLIRPGKNYGWPVISHGKEYWSPARVGEGTEKPGMESAVKVYIPSIAPGSLLLYSGKAFPEWRGNLFSGALKLRHLNRVVLDKAGRAVAEERLLGTMDERIRALAESPEGWLYLSTDSGRILRLRPED